MKVEVLLDSPTALLVQFRCCWCGVYWTAHPRCPRSVGPRPVGSRLPLWKLRCWKKLGRPHLVVMTPMRVSFSVSQSHHPGTFSCLDYSWPPVVSCSVVAVSYRLANIEFPSRCLISRKCWWGNTLNRERISYPNNISAGVLPHGRGVLRYRCRNLANRACRDPRVFFFNPCFTVRTAR